MSNPIGVVSARTAFRDIGLTPAEAAIHARARRRRRRGQLLLSGTSAVFAVVLFAGLLAVR
ncbi:MAG: hypothetical protein M3394_04590, partial [Actinomycetota bacterium]|nr:hypothetical protein [Actinomycetota bacterium]